jgi:tripartite-type tricarboxylate transporter receptor subunit TctC
MLRKSRRDVLKGALAAPFVLQAGAARSQDTWPNRPVHIMLPFGAGGAADTVCRVVFAKASEQLKQSIVIENRTGGNTVVASSAALQAPKDGYTFLVNAAQFLINPVLMKDLPFDFRTSFVPVTRLAAFPQVVAVRKDFPAATIEEYLAHAKANPGKVTFGTPPAAGMAHMAGALIQNRTGTRLVHAPYRLATEAVRDLSGGHLDSVILTTSTIQPALQSNTARILAITSAKRTPILPDVPTLGERIIPGFDMDDWVGLFAVTGVPAPIIQQMQKAVAEASKDPAVVARLAPLGTNILGDSTESFAKFLDEQREVLTRLIAEANIKLE